MPIFTPYLEMPHLEDYGLNIVNIRAAREDDYQLIASDFEQLEDPKIKAFFLVNPGNPTGVALDARCDQTLGRAGEDEAQGPHHSHG